MNEFEAQLKKELERQKAPVVDRSVWLKINDAWRQHKKGNSGFKRIWWVAAAGLLLLISGYFLFSLTENKEQKVLAQYGLEAYDFPHQVAQKLSDLDGLKIPKDQAEYFEILKSQLLFLDQQYQNYLGYIEKNGYQEFIGKQIQNYYEVKIKLLEKIQLEIEKLKIKSDEKNMETQAVEWNI